MRFLILMAAILISSPTAAQDADPVSVLALKGQCQNLTAGAEDLTTICASEITQVIYTNDRMDLAVWTESDSQRFFVFSGVTEPGPDAMGFLHIDTVIVGPDGSGDNNVTHKATGLCTYGKFIEGNAQYRCEVVTKDGTIYNFAYLTDPGEPESMYD